MTSSASKTGYAPVNDLHMYYEIHGAGEPLVLLHGGLGDTRMFNELLPAFAKNRQVIAIDQQAHGHTADIDRSMSFPQMADDTAALLRHLGIKQADIFGYSDGGNVGLGLTIRHPEVVRKLAVAGTNFNNEGLVPGLAEFFEHASPEDMGDEMREFYVQVAPRPEDWPVLIKKVMQMAIDFPGWTPEEVQAIAAPTLIIVGDNDIVRPEHAVEMFRLLQHGHLAVLPRTDHFMRLQSPEWLLSMLNDFFDAPMPDEEASEHS